MELEMSARQDQTASMDLTIFNAPRMRMFETQDQVPYFGAILPQPLTTFTLPPGPDGNCGSYASLSVMSDIDRDVSLFVTNLDTQLVALCNLYVISPISYDVQRVSYDRDKPSRFQFNMIYRKATNNGVVIRARLFSGASDTIVQAAILAYFQGLPLLAVPVAMFDLSPDRSTYSQQTRLLVLYLETPAGVTILTGQERNDKRVFLYRCTKAIIPAWNAGMVDMVSADGTRTQEISGVNRSSGDIPIDGEGYVLRDQFTCRWLLYPVPLV
jgi:hypothetical protein